MVVKNRQQRRFSVRSGLAALAFLPAAFVGCKTSSWAAKPSWWASNKTADASKLSTAPAFNGDVSKPSGSNTPYPVTTTPDGYVISDREGATATAAATASAPVTYGTTPPPQTAAVPTAVERGLPPAESPLSSVSPSVGGASPQVGPYASSSGGAPPPLDSTPASAGSQPPSVFTAAPPPTNSGFPTASPATDPAAATPLAGSGWSASRGSIDSLSSPPAAGGGATTPPLAPTRTADARSAAGFAPAAAATPAAAEASSRYGSATSSRFGGAAAGYDQAPPPAAFPTPLPTELPQQPAAAVPAASPAAPAVFPGTTAPPAQPAFPATQPAAPLGAPPTRPDPFYRPAGTSSYRPSRELLDDETEAPGGVQPVAFDEPAE